MNQEPAHRYAKKTQKAYNMDFKSGTLNRSVAKAHFHAELWPYIDELPKAKQCFFCIPSHLIDPKSLDKYTQKIGVRPNYILYTCEWSPPKENDAEQSE